MTFGTTSSVFRSYMRDCVEATASFTPHLSASGTWMAALFKDAVTPDNDVASAAAQYGAGGVWTTANEATSGTSWPAKGRPLAWSTATRWAATADTLTFDSDDTASVDASVTFTTPNGPWGDLIFDDALASPVADQALCYHSFGAEKLVSGGTFTIQWHANGVMRVQTLAA
jgi:hypothetical protein